MSTLEILICGQTLIEADTNEKLQVSSFESLDPKDFQGFCENLIKKMQEIWEAYFPQGKKNKNKQTISRKIS